MIKRTLVTTADERTWPDKNTPIVFLGEWCKRFSRRTKWQSYDTQTVPYHWDDRDKLQKDFSYWQQLHEIILVDLSDKLNELHGTKHTKLYWRLLIGPWLLSFIQILFDRWYMLKKAFELYEIDTCKIIDVNHQEFVPDDMEDFLRHITGEFWNEVIYGEIINKAFSKRVGVESVALDVSRSSSAHRSVSIKKIIKIILFACFSMPNRLMRKKANYFFISTYLPVFKELKLQIKLGQFPSIFKSSPACKKTKAEQRVWTLGKQKYIGEFESLVRDLIPRHLPINYVEGFTQLIKTAQSTVWPTNPEVIFTSNAHIGNDVFKVWAAEKREKNGATLVIGQHGGYTGTTELTSFEDHEYSISDRFCTWGWVKKDKPKLRPLGNIKTFGKQLQTDSSGGAVLVEFAMTRQSLRMHATPISSQWLDYFETQCALYAALPTTIQDQLVIRMYPTDFGWEQRDRWLDRFPEVKLEKSNKKLKKSIAQNRLCIATYNATTILETLSWNVPTIIYLDPILWRFSPEAKVFFDYLIEAKILHQDPESAANTIVEVWDNIDGWWESDSVQKARKIFCDQYAASPENMMKKLVNILRQPAPQVLNNNE